MFISEFTPEMTVEQIQTKRQVPDSSIAGYSAHYNFVFLHNGREKEAHIPAASLEDAWTRFEEIYRLPKEQVREVWLIRPGRAPKLEYKKSSVEETIRQVDDGYRLYSQSGKNLGTYPTRAGAEHRERQVQYFKHKDKGDS